jgi:hypothetical protein
MPKPDKNILSKRNERVNAMEDEFKGKVVQIEVTTEMPEDLKEIIQSYYWDSDEGLRMVLGAGIGALTSQRVLAGDTEADKILLLTRRLAESEGKLAGVGHALSEANEVIKKWELSNGAFRELTVSLEQTIRQQNEEIDGLRARLQEKETVQPRNRVSWRGGKG